MKPDIDEDELGFLCELLKHERLHVEVSRLDESRADLVPRMLAKGLLVVSWCGPNGVWPNRHSETRPLSVSISSEVAEYADVVAWRLTEDAPLRWVDRSAIAETRRARVYCETDLTARQKRRGERAEGLESFADGRHDDSASDDLDAFPDDGRSRRPTRLIGVSSVWYPPAADADACPTCGGRLDERGYPNTGEYCIRCDSRAGHARPSALRRTRR